MSKQRSSSLNIFLFVIFVIFVGILLFSSQKNPVSDDSSKYSSLNLITCMNSGKHLDSCANEENLSENVVFILNDAHEYCIGRFPDHNVNDPQVINCLADLMSNYPIYSGQGYFKAITYCLHEQNTIDYCLDREQLDKKNRNEMMAIYNNCGDTFPKINFLHCIDVSVLKSKINELMNDSIFNLFVNRLSGRHISLEITTLDGKSTTLNNVDEIEIYSGDKNLFTLEEIAYYDLVDLQGDVVWACEDIEIHTTDVHGTKNIISRVQRVHIGDPIAEVVSISAPTNIRKGADFFIKFKTVPPNSNLYCKILKSNDVISIDNYHSHDVIFSDKVKSGSFKWDAPQDMETGEYFYVIEDSNAERPVYSDYFKIVEN
ncbi:hypothetical protein GF354_00860 [Candidatus Peregrinibacteria bacterium]|nr:hypothetical protein [Candidatus Peregrinibacteria bacterium]